MAKEKASPSPRASTSVVQAIRSRIARGELKQGDRLPPEGALMEQFGVSKPTLREALRVLETDGLVRVERGYHGGARILIPTGHDAGRSAALVLQHRGATLGELYAVRLFLEASAPQLIAARPDREAAVAQLEGLARAALGAPTAKIAVQRGHDFHRELVRMTGNRALVLFTEMLEHIGEEAGVNLLAEGKPSTSGYLRQALDEHLRLAELIRHGDLARADELWRDHLRRTFDQVSDGPLTVYGRAATEPTAPPS